MAPSRLLQTGCMAECPERHRGADSESEYFKGANWTIFWGCYLYIHAYPRVACVGSHILLPKYHRNS